MEEIKLELAERRKVLLANKLLEEQLNPAYRSLTSK